MSSVTRGEARVHIPAEQNASTDGGTGTLVFDLADCGFFSWYPVNQGIDLDRGIKICTLADQFMQRGWSIWPMCGGDC